MNTTLCTCALGVLTTALLAGPGPRLKTYSGEFAHGLTVVPPWRDGGELIINFPEHLLHEKKGMQILGYSDKGPSGRWEVVTDGLSAKLDVESPTTPGVWVKGIAKVVGRDRIRMRVRIANASTRPLLWIQPLYCFQYRHLLGFPQWLDNFNYTYVVIKGNVVALADVPTSDRAARVKGGIVLGCTQDDNGFAERNGGLIRPGVDAAIAAVTSLDHRRKLIISWTPGKSVLSNARIPCLHADPYYGTIEPGESREATGLILFSEDSLEKKMKRLLKQGAGAPFRERTR